MKIAFFSNGGKALPSFVQSEIAECGLTCLAMISAFHGHDVNLSGLRRRFPISSRGINLKQLIEVSNKLQFNTRAVKVEATDLKDLAMPCILHWELNHFVVLKSVIGNKITIHDPARGIRKLTREELERSFTGIALELRPTQEFKPIVEKSQLDPSQLFSHIDGIKKILALVFILSLILMAMTIAMPVFTQLVFDEVLGSSDQQLLTLLMLGLTTIVLFRGVVGYIRSLLLLFLGNVLSFHASASVFRKLIHLPLKYFTSRHIGDVVSRFGSLEQIKEFLTKGMVEVAVDGIMTTMMLVLMFVYSLQLSLVAVATIAFYAIIRYLTISPFRRMSEEAIVSQAKEQSNFMETVRGIQSIKLYGGEADRHSLWQNNYTRVLNANAGLGRFRIGFNTLREVLFGIERVIVLYLGVHLVFERQLSPGMLIAFLAYKDQFADKVSSLIENGIQFKMLNLHLDRIADIVLEELDLSNDDDDLAVEGQLQVNSLSYRHDDQSPPIFKDLNLTVQPGESIAIVGPSGCGKSTLLRLMVGLYKVDNGCILVDGQDISKNRLSYQKQIATVMQDDHLLSGTIIENIAFFEPDPDLERVYACAVRAQIQNDILAMPMRYNSLIGDMGSTLSGGQKQRLLLARALYRQPKLLFLDEATSQLDRGLENLVNKAIGELKLTRIIIAHRIETILSADRIFELSNGALVEIDKDDYQRLSIKPMLQMSQSKLSAGL